MGNSLVVTIDFGAYSAVVAATVTDYDRGRVEYSRYRRAPPLTGPTKRSVTRSRGQWWPAPAAAVF